MSNGVKYVAPSLDVLAFSCPHCGAFSEQIWSSIQRNFKGAVANYSDIKIAQSLCCGRISIWYQTVMVYPEIQSAPLPNPDMPEDIIKYYEEARSIENKSPRGAAALLRLCIQKICIELGEKGENINKDISNLVKKGLPKKIQKSLDIVRVTGNNAVHPGVIDLDDNPEVARALFGLINIITENQISEHKKIDEIFDALPESSRDAIENRDSES